jgi:serine/threonine protein kinase
MDCGYLLPVAAQAPSDSANRCPNLSCGAIYSPGDRVCRHCGAALPTVPGTILHGCYRIERQLAIGGFGAVYLATDTKHNNRQVAIKDMLCADPEEFGLRLNFFRREAEILRNLDGMAIVPRVHDFIQEGQSAHLVLEYIRGRDLLQILQTRQKPFPLERVIEWGIGICDVLCHMHAQTPPIVHRDVKPDNIMLLDDERSIKMIDFGTARDMGRTRQSQLAAKTRVYTEGYAPPEQIVGKPEPRSDLFALAGTLYHLATGKAPEGTYTARQLDRELGSPQCLLPGADRWFYELIKINLSEDLNQRYFNARQFKADLAQRKLTKDRVCPRCRTVNPVRKPYCFNCAAPLTEPTPPCAHCGKVNRMGSRFCIHCGHQIR